MSYADKIFIDMCKDILENGTSTEGEKVRPHWEDGTPAYTVKKFGVVNRYDLRAEFPALTLRKTGIKSAIDEILWIYQRKSNNIRDLNSSIWDEWADENGSIGKAYGYQIGKMNKYKDVSFNGLMKAFPDYYLKDVRFIREKDNKCVAIERDGCWEMSQIDKVIYDLKNNPFSRRIMINMYNFEDLHEMNLYPCAYGMIFNVTQREGENKLTLNAVLTQRSQDVLAANNWNVVQYSALIHMLAQVCDMYVGELVHIIADAHIYDRHIPLIKELIERVTYKAPIVTFNPEIKDFYDFTTDDIKVENYMTGEQIKNIPIAI